MKSTKHGLFGGILTSLILFTSPLTAQDVPQVVTSIQPVHSLVSLVMKGVGKPDLLVEGGGSPHSFSLRPSQARALEQADAVFWVGEELEAFLQQPLESLSSEAQVVTLSQSEGIQLLASRSEGTWEGHSHDDDHTQDDHDEANGRHEHDHQEEEGHAHDGMEHDEAHGHDEEHDADEEHDHGAGGHSHEQDHSDREGHAHGLYDMHVWLSPDNARAMLAAIRETLVDVDPEHSEAYRANTDAALESLDALEAELRDQLRSVADRPYIVFHDAYRYFEEAFGLNAVGSVTLSPERKPGVRRMSELREKVEQLEAVCVFSEPQFEPRLVTSLVKGTEVRTGELDPLGAALEPGPGAYSALMRELGNEITDCLGG